MAHRSYLAALACLACAWANGQTPEVSIFADLRFSILREGSNNLVVRLYDPNGKPSTIGFRMILETGNRAMISQKLQNISSSADPSGLDEMWIESTGVWRIGKQYIPFGNRSLVNETVPAVRIDTQLLFQEAPISIAYADAGEGRTRGFTARIGREIGLSLAVGDHFAIQGGTLTPMRPPSAAPGKGRGYELMYGADANISLGSFILNLEYVAFRKGETIQDVEMDVTDIRLTWFLPNSANSYTVGWAKDWANDKSSFRLQGDFNVSERVILSPYFRFNRSTLEDFGVFARIRF